VFSPVAEPVWDDPPFEDGAELLSGGGGAEV